MVSDITKAVHEAWRFSIPPIVRLCIALSFFHYFGGDTILANAWHAVVAHASAIKASSIKETLDAFGLTAIIPIAVGVAFVVILYTFERVAFGIANAVPIRFSRGMNRAVMLLPAIEEIARRSPAIRHVADISQVIDLALAKARAEGKTEALSSVEYWRERSSSVGTHLSFIQFLWVWSVICALIVEYHSPGYGFPLIRLVVSWVVLFAVNVIVACQYAYVIEQLEYSRVYAAQVLITLDNPVRAPDEDTRFNQVHSELREINKELERGSRWWWFSFGMLNWLQMLKHFQPPRYRKPSHTTRHIMVSDSSKDNTGNG